MLALAATNVVGGVLFAAVYMTAGVRLLSQGAFLVCLVCIFVLVTTLWVRVEARHRDLGALRRIGRAAAGFAAVVLLMPALVLMPAFWLETLLPPDAGLTAFLGPLMTIVLISLALVFVVNVVGALVTLARSAVTSGTR
jgi:hypothetical protein